MKYQIDSTFASKIFPMKNSLSLFFILSLLFTTASYGSPNNKEEKKLSKVKVLVLGTFHFANAPDFNPIDAPEQQNEIKEFVNNIAEFNPTKIALEFERKDSTIVDSIYKAYLSGDHKLTVNERQQIGFRLAKQLDHKAVYPIDYKKPWGMQPVMEWAKKNDPGFIEYFRHWQTEHARWDSVLHRTNTIPEILKLYNTKEKINEIQTARMRTLEVGAGDNYIGVKPVASVYERNMRIFANLIEIAEPGDRILIVYGIGHAYFFHEFVSQHYRMEIVPLNNYLK